MVPVYNGAKTLPELVRRIHESLTPCASRHEVLLVNDASPDESWRVIEELAASDPCVRGLDLSRNFGQHNALLAGLRDARCEIVVTMDDDLQNPPEEIPTLLGALGPECDVVYGEPIVKRHGFGRRIATRVVAQGLRFLGGRTAPMVSAFRAFRTELRDGFADYVGPDVSIDGLLTWQTDRFRSVRVRHEQRAHGASNYSFRKLVRHALTMITAFSTRPLRLATTMGFFVILFGIAVMIYVLARLAVEGNSVPGFPFLASIISIFSGAQLFAIGVIGEYLARVHVRVMARPSYAIRARTESPAGGGLSVAGGAPAGSAPCEELTWDSEFWGFQIGRVTSPRLHPAQARSVAARCDREGFRCTFLLAAADDAETARAAEGVGFVPVDTRITLRRPGGLALLGPEPGSPVAIRPAGEADEEQMADLARVSHTDSRFFFDSRFPRTRAGDLYAAWIRRGLAEASRHVLLGERDGRMLGYVVIGDEPQTIELIAVAEPARGQGVGRALVEAAIAERPEQPMLVVTQARNVGALRLYQANGFEIETVETWYHRWR